MNGSKERRPESFESWCRRAGILPGDPTPAVSSPRSSWDRGGEAFQSLLKGPDVTVSLATTLEIFCLRTGRSFRAKGTAVRWEQFDRPGSVIRNDRELIACKNCPDTHLLLTTYQAACFGLIGQLVGGRRDLSRRELSFGRRNNRHLLDRKRFPPVENVAADGKKKAA